MSKISSLMATETVVDVEFPDVDGFIISLVYLTREDLVKIRNASLTFKFNKRTRQREEEIDNDNTRYNWIISISGGVLYLNIQLLLEFYI